MNRRLLYIAILFLYGCDISGNPDRLIIAKNAGVYHFANAVQSNWETVCFFGPYSDNVTAKRVLGVTWDLESKSAVHTDDGITLAVFQKNDEILYYAEIPRIADFAKYSGECFVKSKAVFNINMGNITIMNNKYP